MIHSYVVEAENLGLAFVVFDNEQEEILDVHVWDLEQDESIGHLNPTKFVDMMSNREMYRNNIIASVEQCEGEEDG